VGLGLGAQAGEGRLRQFAIKAGFRRFHRATETPFNMIFEARSDRSEQHASARMLQERRLPEPCIHSDLTSRFGTDGADGCSSNNSRYGQPTSSQGLAASPDARRRI
jgi:hypothetical protein